MSYLRKFGLGFNQGLEKLKGTTLINADKGEGIKT